MKRRIIIVEDDPAISDILRILLQRNGFEVEEFVVGKPLMHPLENSPDLFLLDKQLADSDGLVICHHLKHQPQTCHIPVIILSASPGLQEQAREVGADAFIEKPFSSRRLLNTIRDVLEHSITQR